MLANRGVRAPIDSQAKTPTVTKAEGKPSSRKAASVRQVAQQEPARAKASHVPAESSKRTKAPKKVSAAAPLVVADGLAAELQLPVDDVLTFERNGWLVTKRLLPREEVKQLQIVVSEVVVAEKLKALQQRVRVLCPRVDPSKVQSEEAALQLLAKHGSDPTGFLQFFNLHRSSDIVRRVATSRRLAGVAAQLLGTRRVRLYQDCVFLKEPGFSETNWHSDLRMAPLDTNQFVTLWLPLRPISGGLRDSGLLFATGSHRDFALPFWHDMRGRGLEDRGYGVRGTGAMQLGDASWHHGWTLHCAGAQPSGSRPRSALALSYFADGARLLDSSDPSVHRHMLHSEDAESYRGWLAELGPGARAAHKELLLVYP